MHFKVYPQKHPNPPQPKMEKLTESVEYMWSAIRDYKIHTIISFECYKLIRNVNKQKPYGLVTLSNSLGKTG